MQCSARCPNREQYNYNRIKRSISDEGDADGRAGSIVLSRLPTDDYHSSESIRLYRYRLQIFRHHDSDLRQEFR